MSNRILHMVQDFAIAGDEFEVSGTRATLAFGDFNTVAPATANASGSAHQHLITRSALENVINHHNHELVAGACKGRRKTCHRRRGTEAPPPKDHVSGTAGAVALGLTAMKISKRFKAKCSPAFNSTIRNTHRGGTRDSGSEDDIDVPLPMQKLTDGSTFLDDTEESQADPRLTLSRAVWFEVDCCDDEHDLIEKRYNESAPPLPSPAIPLASRQDLRIITPVGYPNSTVRRRSSQGARELVERLSDVAVSLKASVAARGETADFNFCLSVANDLIKSQEQRDREDTKELHKMWFDHHHRTADREQRQLHHEDTLKFNREEKWWLARVCKGRDECIQSISATALRSLGVHYGLELLIRARAYQMAFAHGGLWRLASNSIDKWLYQCPQGQRSLASYIPSTFETWMPSTAGKLLYLLELSASMSEAVCHIRRGISLLVCVALASWFILKLVSQTLPQARTVVTCILAVGLARSALGIPVLCFLVGWTLAYAYTNFVWWRSKGALNKPEGEYPTNREVNDALDTFENIRFLFNVLAWIVSGGALGFLALSQRG